MSDRRFGYGYPSYVETAHHASCYDGKQFGQGLYERTARWNADHAKNMAASAAASQPICYDPGPVSFSGGAGSGAWTDFGVGKEPDVLNIPSSPRNSSSKYRARLNRYGRLFRLLFVIWAYGSILLHFMHMI